MVRSIGQIEREIEREKLVRDAERLGPSRDNDGRIVRTPEERRAAARRAVDRLERERDNLRKVLDRPLDRGRDR